MYPSISIFPFRANDWRGPAFVSLIFSQINEKREQVKYERRMVLILSRLLMRERSSKQWYCSEYPLQQCESNGTDSEDGLRSGNIWKQRTEGVAAVGLDHTAADASLDHRRWRDTLWSWRGRSMWYNQALLAGAVGDGLRGEEDEMNL